MTPRVRLTMFSVSAAGLAALFAWGLGGLRDFGRYDGVYGLTLERVALPERHATNIVAPVVLDYRGLDTLGESFILFASVTGVALLLRSQRDETQEPDEAAERMRTPATSDLVRTAGLGLIGFLVLLGLYVAAHGALTPGGGFQGGVVLAVGSLQVYLAGEFLAFRRLNPIPLIDAAHGAGAAWYIGVGLLGLAVSGTFLTNVLPLGTPGDLLSAGSIPLLNLGIALEVAGGLVLLLSEFFEQALLIRSKQGRPG